MYFLALKSILDFMFYRKIRILDLKIKTQIT